MADVEIVAPGMILDFCQSVDVQVKLPEFMAQYQDLHRRASATGYYPDYTGFPSPKPKPKPDSGGSKNYRGLKLGARIGIGIAVPVVVLIIILIGILILRHRRRNRVPQVSEIQQQEKYDGGLPEYISNIPEILDTTMPPPSYMGTHEYRIESSGAPIQQMSTFLLQPTSSLAPKSEPMRVPQGATDATIHEVEAVRARLETAGVPVHEIEATRLRLQAAGIPIHEIEAGRPAVEAAGNPRHEFADTQSSHRHELTASPSPHPIGSDSASFGPGMSRIPISPPSTTSTPFFPPPWDNTGGTGYDSYEHPHAEPQRTEEDLEIQRLEEEAAQVRLRRERLQHLYDLGNRKLR